MNNSLKDTLQHLGVDDYIRQVEQSFLAGMVAPSSNDNLSQPTPHRLPRLGFVYEVQGISEFKRWITRPTEGTLREAFVSAFGAAFACWRALTSLSSEDEATRKNGVSTTGLGIVAAELIDEPLKPELTLAFRLAAAGLLSERTAETRLELKRFTLGATTEAQDWRGKVIENIFSAFVLLVRKNNGWEDIDAALSRIAELRTLQKEYEDTYIDRQDGQAAQTRVAVELVGLYHLAQLLTITGEYLRDGEARARIQIQIDRHHERAVTAFEAGKSSLLAHLADLLWAGCRELAQNSIWTHVETFGESARQFARLLADRGRPKPVIELWHSQQKAFEQRLLDPYPRAILVEMPTSAGKTLLAKFVIVQTKALNPTGKIAYIVPTRALVNQITIELRQDFSRLNYKVEQAVPAFELDPTEERLLRNSPDILVTTPEKLDLLIRSDHPATQDLSLVIADEAHNISDKNRGARLELLLGTIKRDRSGARFLLLSPFLPNGDELVTWLGENRALPPIQVDWKPGRKVVGSVNVQGRRKERKLYFRTLPASANVDVEEGLEFPIGSAEGLSPVTLSKVTRSTAQALLAKGSILILCNGRASAAERATSISEVLDEIPSTPLLEAVCRYVDAEVGRTSPLSKCLRHGVAFHHSGLSQETRWLIEALINRGIVNVICGTTTLAQGMNFPIRTVVVETLQKGSSDAPLTYQDFWNIAGRAGRALIDTIGVIAFPERDSSDRTRYVEFLKGEAEAVSSQLTTLISSIGDISESFEFNLEAVRTHPQLSALLQFLAHALRVSGSSDIADEVEDLLRASLVYYQAQREGEGVARRLIDLCRLYLLQASTQKGILPLADKTGFATPSVLTLFARTRSDNEFSDPTMWQTERLFGDDITPMQRRVEAIANLPEIELGQTNQFPFSSELVAKILRDWVMGETLDTLAEKHWVNREDSPDKKLMNFSSYLFGRIIGSASWGMGALETVSLGDVADEQWEQVGYLPSMIYFGVRRKEAIWMRMVGVPRIVADSLGQLWQRRNKSEPETFDDLRQWVSTLTDSEWSQSLPKSSSLTSADMNLIWQVFSGQTV